MATCIAIVKMHIICAAKIVLVQFLSTIYHYCIIELRGGPRTFRIFEMEFFVSLINSFQQLTNVTKSSILDVAGVLDIASELSNLRDTNDFHWLFFYNKFSFIFIFAL